MVDSSLKETSFNGTDDSVGAIGTGTYTIQKIKYEKFEISSEFLDLCHSLLRGCRRRRLKSDRLACIMRNIGTIIDVLNDTTYTFKKKKQGGGESYRWRNCMSGLGRSCCGSFPNWWYLKICRYSSLVILLIELL